MERDLRRKFLLKESKTLENGTVAARNLDVEIVIVQRLEFDLDVAGLHDFVDLSVLLSTDKLAVLVSKLNLEADLMLVDLSPPA
jgi:hypothetical protein